MLDIFRSDAFGVVPLSLAINNLKFVPGYVSSRGIFTESSIAVTAVVIEEKNYTLTLTRTTAPTNTWSFGSLVLSDGVHTVTSPVSARALDAIRPIIQAELKK